jgi:hypothetical protein
MVCVNRFLKRQGNDMGTAWEKHGMCESAFTVRYWHTGRYERMGDKGIGPENANNKVLMHLHFAVDYGDS